VVLIITIREVFFVKTCYRDGTNLKEIIKNHVIEGTTIYTDCWAGYNNLVDLGFEHFTDNHSSHFIDPVSGVNTQLI
jgi:hypothetical protein